MLQPSTNPLALQQQSPLFNLRGSLSLFKDPPFSPLSVAGFNYVRRKHIFWSLNISVLIIVGVQLTGQMASTESSKEISDEYLVGEICKLVPFIRSFYPIRAWHVVDKVTVVTIDLSSIIKHFHCTNSTATPLT